jgi:transposase
VSTVDPRDKRIAELEAQLAERDQLIASLRGHIDALTARVAELEAQLGRNSSNSSKPPSSDPPGTRRKEPSSTGRKRGGQPGHPGAKRELLPLEQVDELKRYIPKRCGQCRTQLRGEDPAPLRHQVTEVPPIKPVVTEYQCHALTCEQCGAVTRAELPPDVPSGAFGPRLTAMVAVCTGAYRMPKRIVQELLSAFLGVDLSLGSVPKLEQRVSVSVADAVEAARRFVRNSRHVHLDETGWREEKHRAWLWVAATPLVSVFEVVRSRGKEVAQRMLGLDFEGTAISDRWCAYNWLHVLRRQVCWAHLLREFQGFVDRGRVCKKYGQMLLDEMAVAFEWWHRARDGTITRRTFQRKMRPLMREVGRLLREAAVRLPRKQAGTCQEILKLEDAMWTFVYVEGVDPTNNRAERALRPAVIWRKGSFGTDSQSGSRFVERILTVVSTLRSQGRNILEFLTAAGNAALGHCSAPSLLPAQPTSRS